MNSKKTGSCLYYITIGLCCLACATKSSKPETDVGLGTEIQKRLEENSGLLPIEAFAKQPAITQVSISPGGGYFGLVRNLGKERGLFTVNVKTGVVVGVMKTQADKARFRWYDWLDEDHLIISIIYLAELGKQNFKATKLFFAPADGTEESRILVEPGVANTIVTSQDNVVDMLPDDPNHILLSGKFKNRYPGVYKVNVNTGKMDVVKREERNIWGWMTDQRGIVRLGWGSRKNGEVEFIKVRHKDEDDWTEAWEYDVETQDEVIPIGFGIDPDTLYLKAYHKDRKAVFKVDLSKPDFPMTLIAYDKKYDIDGGLIYSPKTRDVVGIYHGEAHDSRIFFDENYKNFQDSVNKALTETENYIVSMSRDEKQYVLFSTSEKMPGTYYWGDRDNNTLTKQFETYPLLTPDKLSQIQKVIYNTRDGVEIEAYLSLPKGREGPFPTVVHPHGGPRSRDYGDFDYWTAFFVNRGYAVFRPNFRGSSGYGLKFKTEANQGYGKGMQDDITDGTNWLIEQGIADRDRICIVGASYGGYAALMGTVKTPDLFKCAVSFAGLSDISGMVKRKKKYVYSTWLKRYYGLNTTELRKVSPVRRVSEIKVPILLVHGKVDKVVPVRQSRVMAKALKKHNKEHKYVEFENGNHYLSDEGNRIRLFQEMDLFLAEHLEK